MRPNLSTLKADIEEIKKRHNVAKIQHITHLPDGGMEIYREGDKPLTYYPPKTLQDFHEDKSIVRMILGPFGSGKSTTCCADIIKHACQMPAWYRGIRKSKWVIVRNTTGELETTTLQTWLTWFRDTGLIRSRKKPVIELNHRFYDNDGIVELDIIFLALDRPDNLRKLLSFEFTGAFTNETRELPAGIFTYLVGRRGRYPAKELCPKPFWKGIIADTNPPDIDHYLYKLFEVDKPNKYRLWKQPPGLIKNKEGTYIDNVNADNFQYLQDNYYTDMALNATQEFIKVYCLGDYGMISTGMAVYPDYNDDLHSVESIKPVPGVKLGIGQDFGLTPAAIIVQFLPQGIMLVLEEIVADNMGARQFAEHVLKPHLLSKYAGFEIEEIQGDPAGATRSESEEKACIEVFNDVGLKAEKADSNLYSRRLDSVNYWLTRIVGGRPALQIDRSKCPILRKGFIGEYKRKRVAVQGEERYKDKPDKNGYSHIHDALQYISMLYTGELLNAKYSSIAENSVGNFL